jgi:hypothetical protein
VLDIYGLSLGIKRKSVKLRITNTGSADAHNCSVELNVPPSTFNNGKLGNNYILNFLT